jgi:hypothetical protein
LWLERNSESERASERHPPPPLGGGGEASVSEGGKAAGTARPRADRVKAGSEVFVVMVGGHHGGCEQDMARGAKHQDLIARLDTGQRVSAIF